MKKERIIKLIILILILCVLYLTIRSAYSRYTSKAFAVVEKGLAQWVIKVNNTDITKNYTEPTEFVIDSFVWDWGEGSHVAEGKVAPGMTGTFEIEIDPTDTQVAYEYFVEIGKPEVNLLHGTTNDISIVLDSVKLNGEDVELESKEVYVDTGEEVTNTVSTSGENTTGDEPVTDENLTNTEGTSGARETKTVYYFSAVKQLSEIQSSDENVRKDKLIVTVKWENDEDKNDIDSEIGSILNNIIKLEVKFNAIQYVGEPTP